MSLRLTTSQSINSSIWRWRQMLSLAYLLLSSSSSLMLVSRCILPCGFIRQYERKHYVGVRFFQIHSLSLCSSPRYRSDIDTYEKKSSLTGFTQLFIAPFGPCTCDRFWICDFLRIQRRMFWLFVTLRVTVTMTWLLCMRSLAFQSSYRTSYFTKDGGDSWNKVMDAPVRSLTHSSAHAQWSLFTKDHPQV